jgi:DNA-binding transcriptional MerR regulator
MVPVSALRYYADIGLLEPAAVDPDSGYRYYTADQLPQVNRILALKDLGMSLEEIRNILDESVDSAQLRGMLRLKRAEIGRHLAEEQARLDRVESRLRLIEQEGAMSEQDVVLKTVEPVVGLGTRDTVSGPAGIQEFMADVFGALAAGGLPVAGPPITRYHDSEFDIERIDLSIVVPVAGPVDRVVGTPAGRTLERATVPGGNVAAVVHVGPYETIHEAYQALGTWFGEHGHTGGGPVQEIYLNDPNQEIYLNDPNQPGPNVTEIRMPVAS